MSIADDLVKEAQQQEEDAKRRAEHPVSDLRDLNTNLDPDAEAEGKEKVEDVPLALTLEETTQDEAPKKRTTRKEG